MNIEDIKARVYFLAGQLEEAKKMFNDAAKEIEKERELAQKKSSNGHTETITTPSDSTVSYGEPASVQ